MNETIMKSKRFPKFDLFRVTPISRTSGSQMFHYQKDKKDNFSPQTMDYQLQDAMIHLVMSSSSCIVTIYGYCGALALHDCAKGGSPQETVEEKGPLPGDEFLDVAHRIVAGCTHRGGSWETNHNAVGRGYSTSE